MDEEAAAAQGGGELDPSGAVPEPFAQVAEG
jgi:hypothetical protein